MKPIVINCTADIPKILSDSLYINPKCDTVVFDIHRTTLYQNKNNQPCLDEEVLVYITYLLKHYNPPKNIIFCHLTEIMKEF